MFKSLWYTLYIMCVSVCVCVLYRQKERAIVLTAHTLWCDVQKPWGECNIIIIMWWWNNFTSKKLYKTQQAVMKTTLTGNTRVRCVQILPTTALCRANTHAHLLSLGGCYSRNVLLLFVYEALRRCCPGGKNNNNISPFKIQTTARGLVRTRVRRRSEHSRPRIVVSRLSTGSFENNPNNKTLYYDSARRSRSRQKIKTDTLYPFNFFFFFWKRVQLHWTLIRLLLSKRR